MTTDAVTEDASAATTESIVAFGYIEDDPTFSDTVSEFLTAHGISHIVGRSLKDLTDMLNAGRVRALLLDQYVGGVDLAAELPNIRRRFTGPIVMFSSNAELVDRIISLETGADDFMVKSTPMRETLARLRAALRRAEKGTPIDSINHPTSYRRPLSIPPQSQMSFDNWVLRYDERLLSNPNGESVRLTSAERNMMWLLIGHVGTVLDREVISDQVLLRPHKWGLRSVDNLISRLRQRVEKLGGTLRIEAVRNRGYAFFGFNIAGN